VCAAHGSLLGMALAHKPFCGGTLRSWKIKSLLRRRVWNYWICFFNHFFLNLSEATQPSVVTRFVPSLAGKISSWRNPLAIGAERRANKLFWKILLYTGPKTGVARPYL
jgi:hypothetical protein